MLRSIQAYLKRHGRACLSDIAGHLRSDPGAVEPILQLLEAKGRIRRRELKSRNCGACTMCVPSAFVLWEWAGE